MRRCTRFKPFRSIADQALRIAVQPAFAPLVICSAVLMQPAFACTALARMQLAPTQVAAVPPVEIPVSTWLLYDPCVARSCTSAQRKWSNERLATDLARTNEIYRASFAGIELRQRAVVSLLHVASVAEVLDLDCGAAAQDARAVLGYSADRLNVYYVRNPGARGLWCSPDTILIGFNAFSETLAHEVGHALGLAHIPDGEPGARDNLMREAGAMSSLTPAQIETMNYSAASIIHRWARMERESQFTKGEGQ